MNLPNQILLMEVGLRDGLQNEKTELTVEQKLQLVEELEDAGHKFIQVGSFVHPKAVPQMANTDEVFQRIKRKPGITYHSAPIPNLRAMERAVACGCKSVRIAVSLSRGHNIANYKCEPSETLKGFEPTVQKARENNVFIGGGLMMAFGSPWEGDIPMKELKALIDVYVDWGLTDEINLADSAGLAAPDMIYRRCSEVQEAYPQIKQWTLHLHNTRGRGLVNMYAGMRAGITRFETAFAGLGGCPFIPGAAGNISTEDAVDMLDEMGIATGLVLDKVIGVGRKVQEMVGHKGDSYILKAGKSKSLFESIKNA